MDDFSIIHKSELRLEGKDKVLGKTRFADDYKLHREAVALPLYTPWPRAEIISLDTSEAEAQPGVVAVISADDVTGSNSLFGRFPVLAEGEVKYTGDVVACVAAETEKIAAEALKLIKVEYKPLPPVLTLEDAVKAELPPVHEDRENNRMENTYYPQYAGDADAGLKSADKVLDAEYQCPFAVNGYMEPDCILAAEDYITGGIVIYGCIQNVYSIRGSVCAALDLPANRVRVVQTALGGSFGGKNETAMVLASRAALLSRKAGRPVRIKMSRQDVFRAGVKRHPYHFSLKGGVDKNGRITGWINKIDTIGGPYNNQAMFADWRIAVHSAGPYATENVKTDVQAWYSNTPYAGAYRGFSAPQHCFAVESFIDELAEISSMDPAEFRRINFVKPGGRITCGQKVGGEDGLVLPMEKLLNDVLVRGEYEKKKSEFESYNKEKGRYRKGLGLAASY
ncbi:MAG: xanthine dehydrogenase family protein, partial [Spirochaetales bacterium]|nr:xanthine dehydrogenase family protein [Spirochaetales bacterium]